LSKNVIFIKKIVKIAKRWGLCPQTHCFRGWELRPQALTLVILHCEFFSPHLPTNTQTLLESNKRSYFLVIIAGRVHQTFAVEEIMLYFICHRLQKIITIVFNFYVLSPPLIFRWRRSCSKW